MKDKFIIALSICLFLAMIISAVAWGEERYFDCGGRISILKVDSEGIDLPPESEDMKVRWDKECKCLEVETKTAKFRIYPCGKVEKLEWKEINKNEEQGRNFIIYPNTHDVPLILYNNGINSR